ncbi:MAG: SDR family NAD(P)-dependent oxidoreductase [Pseudomonadota bacterium]
MSRVGHAGRRVLVTGVADGIGRATAAAFHEAGARVLGADLKPPESDPGFDVLQLDVSTADAPGILAGHCQDALGGLDVLVNNAGICPVAPLAETDDATWNQTLEVNLSAMFRLCRAAYPLLRDSGAGRVVNIASVSARFANAGMGAYTASKHAVAGLTKSLAAEWGADGVTANYILPGAIVTGITRELREVDSEFREFWENKSPLRRWGQPEDIASGALFLASRDADFITGHGLAIDGGAMAVS